MTLRCQAKASWLGSTGRSATPQTYAERPLIQRDLGHDLVLSRLTPWDAVPAWSDGSAMRDQAERELGDGRLRRGRSPSEQGLDPNALCPMQGGNHAV